MIRAVVDTNTIVSAIIEPRGIPNQILDAARNELFLLVTSTSVVAEVLTTLSRERIRRKYQITPEDVSRIRGFLEADTFYVTLTEEIRGIATHPEDDLILATALAGQAEYLVTGDKHLQKLGSFRDTLIVSPRVFLELLERSRGA